MNPRTQTEDSSYLLKTQPTWLDENLGAPAVQALVQDVYQPLRNVLNPVARAIAKNDLLPEVALPESDARQPRGVSEYCAQLLARGAVGAVTYTVFGKATGGVFRGVGRLAKVEGSAASFLASESAAQIAGAGIHDSLLDAANDRERAANVAGGATSFGIFELCNKSMHGRGVLLKAAALMPIGAIGGASGYAVHEWVAGRQMDLKTLGQSTLDGAALNLLLPAAQHYTGRVIDTMNVRAGRGVPLERYMEYNKLHDKSDSLTELAQTSPLSRIQPTTGEAKIDHRKALIYIPETQSTINAGKLLAHELYHSKAQRESAPELERIAQLLKTDETEARAAFMKLREKEERLARHAEETTRIEMEGFCENQERPPNENLYRHKFEAEFDAFKKSDGHWRPEEDFALLSSKEKLDLKTKNEPAEIVQSLYPELTPSERNGLTKILESWKAETNESVFDLIYGMPRNAWRKALAWSTAISYTKAKLADKAGAFTRAVESDPIAGEWAQGVVKMIDYHNRVKTDIDSRYVSIVTEPLKEFADSIVAEKNKLKELEQLAAKSFEEKKREAEQKHDHAAARIKSTYDYALLSLKQTYNQKVAELRASFSRDKRPAMEPPQPLPMLNSEKLGQLIGFKPKSSIELIEHLHKKPQPNKADFERSPGILIGDSLPRFPSFTAFDRPAPYVTKRIVGPGIPYFTQYDNAYFEPARETYFLNSVEETKPQVEPEVVPASDHDQFVEAAKPLLELRDSYAGVDEVATMFKKALGPLRKSAATADYGTLPLYADRLFMTMPARMMGLGYWDIADPAFRRLILRTQTHRFGFLDHDPWRLFSSILNPNPGSRSIDPPKKYNLKYLLSELRERHQSECDFLEGKQQFELDQAKKRLDAQVSSARREKENLIDKESQAFRQKSQFLGNELTMELGPAIAMRNDSVASLNNNLRELVKQIAADSATLSEQNPVAFPDSSKTADKVMQRALSSTLIFGNNIEPWHRARLSNIETAHLPLHTALRDPRLADLLSVNGKAPVKDLEKIVSAWPQLPDDVKSTAPSLSFKKLLDHVEVYSAYKQISNIDLAREALQWRYSPTKYADMESRFQRTLSIPDPFPTDVTWTHGKYVGRFLQRSDPRRLFMGKHTDSCMRLDGENEKGVWWIQENPQAGFFAVENSSTGEIIAGSRVWQVPQDNGVCFNSIQGKREDRGRDTTILSIYRQAANHLKQTMNLNEVTVGSNSKVPLDGLFRTKSLQVPSVEEAGHLDCTEQKLLSVGE